MPLSDLFEVAVEALVLNKAGKGKTAPSKSSSQSKTSDKPKSAPKKSKSTSKKGSWVGDVVEGIFDIFLD